MAVTIRCNCGATFSVGDNLAGKRVRCARCQQPVLVPSPQVAAQQSAAEQNGAHDEAYWEKLGGKSRRKPAGASAMPRVNTKIMLIIGGAAVVLAGVIVSIVLLMGQKSGGAPKNQSNGNEGANAGAPGEITVVYKLEGAKPELERALRSSYVSRLKTSGIGGGISGGTGPETQVTFTIEGRTLIRNRTFQPLDADDDPTGPMVDIKVPFVEAKLTIESAAGARVIYNVQFVGAAPPETPHNDAFGKATEEASWRGFADRIFQVPVPPAESMAKAGGPPATTVVIDLAKEFARTPDAPWRMERYVYLLVSRTLWTELKLAKEQRIELGMLKSEFGGAAKGREIPPGEWKVSDLHSFLRDTCRAARGVLTAEQLAEFQNIYATRNLALPVVVINARKLPPGQMEKAHLLACVDYKIVSTQLGESLGWPPVAPIAMDNEDAQIASLSAAYEESFALPNAEIKSPRELVTLMNSDRKLVKLFAIHWIMTHDTGEASAEIAAELKKGFGSSWKEYFAREHDDVDDAKLFAYIAAATPADTPELLAISEHSGGVWNRIGIAARGKLFRDCFEEVKKYAREQVQQGKRPQIWDAAIWYRDEGRRRPASIDQVARLKASELDKNLTTLAAEVKQAGITPKN